MAEPDLPEQPPGTRAGAAGLFAVVIGVAALLVVMWVWADLAAVDDDGWRVTGLLAGGAGTTVVAFGLVAVSRSFATDGRRPAAGAVALTSVLGLGCAAVIGLAGVQGDPRGASEPDFGGASVDEPTQVAVELTVSGRRAAARAMGCEESDLGAERQFFGWLVGGDFRSPSVVLLEPPEPCQNGRVDLGPDDGFAYPSLFFSGDGETTTTTSTPSTTAVPPFTPPTTFVPVPG